jgi:hypothetical protein
VDPAWAVIEVTESILIEHPELATSELRRLRASSTGGDAVKYRFGYFLQVAAGRYYALVNSSGGDNFAWNNFFLDPIQGIGFSTTVLAANAEEYLSYTASQQGFQKKIPPFPTDGLLVIRVYGTNDTNVSQPSVDCIWKDLKLTLLNYVNDSTQIIGQFHKQNQPALIIKNNSDNIIYADDAPRNTIAGCLFLPTFPNLIQQRTLNWYRLTTPLERKRIGEIISFEQLFNRKLPRTKIEGDFYGFQINGLLGLIKYQPFTSLNFIFGTLEINYRDNKFRCTLYELFADGEIDSDMYAFYTFNYIYSTR